MVLSVGDLHIRKEEPFFHASLLALDEVISKLDKGDTLLQLGDWFHSSKPYPSVYRTSLKRIQNHPEINFVILAGNHDYNANWSSYSIEPLIEMTNVTFIQDPKIIKIEDMNILFLPWLPSSYVKNKKSKTVKEFYEEEFLNSIRGKEVDYICYHFEDETVFMGGVNHGISLSAYDQEFINSKRLAGHIHLQSKNYLGTPYQTRFDEKGQIGQYAILQKHKKQLEDLPLYLEYLSIAYGDSIPQSASSKLLTVSKAPSIDLVYKKYKNENTFIRDISLTTTEDSSNDEVAENVSTVKEHLSNFVKRNKVDKQTTEYLLNLF